MDRLLTLRDVELRVGLKRSQIYALMGRREFPVSFKLSPKATRWSLAEVDAWVESHRGPQPA